VTRIRSAVVYPVLAAGLLARRHADLAAVRVADVGIRRTTRESDA